MNDYGSAEGNPLEKLIEQALRTVPDRIVISEHRASQDVQPFISSCSSGKQFGVTTTLHAATKTIDDIANDLFPYSGKCPG